MTPLTVYTIYVTGWVVAQTCCISQCANLVYEKWDFRRPLGAKLHTIAIKLGERNYVYVWALPQLPNMGAIGLRGASRRMRQISLFVTFFSFFLFFVSSPRLQVAMVDRFSRSIRQSTTCFRARKFLLGISMMNFHILPKIWKFALRPMATSNTNNSGIFKDRSKLFAPKWGFRGRAI